jgi:ribonuclease-3
MVATDLYEKFPAMDEGELTRLKISLVSGATLSVVAEELGIGQLIVFGESEKGTGARGMHSALENVYESIVGALYLDAGYGVTHDFVHRTLEPYMTPEIARKPISPKSRLQEVTQRDMKCAPEYKLVGEEGPAHAPTFTTVVLVDGKRVGRGVGSSKKESESVAAENALMNLGYLEADDAAIAE